MVLLYNSCYYSYQRFYHTNEASGSLCLVWHDIDPLASFARPFETEGNWTAGSTVITAIGSPA